MPPTPESWLQRTLIRHAVCELFLDSAPLAPLGQRIFANRMAPWMESDLPACGIYVLQEENLETDRYPDPEERRLTLVVELLVRADERLDDRLDSLCLGVEQVISADAIGRHMGELVDYALADRCQPPMPLTREHRHPADSLLLLRLTGTDLVLAEDGNRTIGVAIMNFDVEYAPPPREMDLPDFLTGIVGWSLVVSDEAAGEVPIHAVDKIEFPGTGDTPAPQPERPLEDRLDDLLPPLLTPPDSEEL